MTGPGTKSLRKSRSHVGLGRMRFPTRIMVAVYLTTILSINKVAEANEIYERPLRSRMSAQGENRARFDGDRAIGIAADEDDDHPCKKVPLKGCVSNADDFVSAYNNDDEEFVVICQDTTISLTGAAGVLSVLADGVSKTVACESANKAGFSTGTTPSTSCTLRGDEATSNFQVANEATLRFCSVHFEDWGENDMIGCAE